MHLGILDLELCALRLVEVQLNRSFRNYLSLTRMDNPLNREDCATDSSVLDGHPALEMANKQSDTTQKSSCALISRTSTATSQPYRRRCHG